MSIDKNDYFWNEFIDSKLNHDKVEYIKKDALDVNSNFLTRSFFSDKFSVPRNRMMNILKDFFPKETEYDLIKAFPVDWNIDTNGVDGFKEIINKIYDIYITWEMWWESIDDQIKWLNNDLNAQLNLLTIKESEIKLKNEEIDQNKKDCQAKKNEVENFKIDRKKIIDLDLEIVDLDQKILNESDDTKKILLENKRLAKNDEVVILKNQKDISSYDADISSWNWEIVSFDNDKWVLERELWNLNTEKDRIDDKIKDIQNSIATKSNRENVKSDKLKNKEKAFEFFSRLKTVMDTRWDTMWILWNNIWKIVATTAAAVTATVATWWWFAVWASLTALWVWYNAVNNNIKESVKEKTKGVLNLIPWDTTGRKIYNVASVWFFPLWAWRILWWWAKKIFWAWKTTAEVWTELTFWAWEIAANLIPHFWPKIAPVVWWTRERVVSALFRPANNADYNGNIQRNVS
jgi:hypothetical protein